MTIDPQVRQMLDVLATDAGQLTVKLGVKILETDPQRLVGTMPVDGNRQPFGLLHGGATASLAETLGSVAAMLNCGPESMAVGVDLNITHHRSARGAAVTGVCTPLHVGRTVAAFDIVITDDPDGAGNGPRLSTARLTCSIIARRPMVGGNS